MSVGRQVLNVVIYQNDHLGTPQKLTAVNGAVVWAAMYKAFGTVDVYLSSTVENNIRFAGQYFDQETGLHYNLHRYYNPKTGRYLRADPIRLNGGVNFYSYSSNNPIIVIDPLGLKSSKSCADCPGGEWDVDFGGVFSFTIFVGGGESRVTFTCLSNGKKCTGNLSCFTVGFIVDVGVGWSIDFESIGDGRIISGYYSFGSIKNYTTSFWVFAVPIIKKVGGSTSGNNINFSFGWSTGIAKSYCSTTYILLSADRECHFFRF